MKQLVRRILYANSGGKCALCKTDIVLSRSDGSQYHISEIAHIRGKRPRALRHDSDISDEEMDDLPNLILLCSKCHTMIDKNETDYPVERLSSLKAEHEYWVRTQLGRGTPDGFQVDFSDCVYIKENNHFIHHIDLEFSNRTKTTMRINDISFFDANGNQLEYIPRGQTSPPQTEIELRGKDEYPWRCFCRGPATEDANMTEITMLVSRIGKVDFRKKQQSVLVPRGKFPSGDFFRVIDW